MWPREPGPLFLQHPTVPLTQKVGDLADEEHLFGQGDKANAIYDAAWIPNGAIKNKVLIISMSLPQSMMRSSKVRWLCTKPPVLRAV
jgi:hypothetical protein